MTDRPPIRPSAWYCLLAAPFLIVGASLFLYSLLHGVLHITDSLTQVIVPGETRLELRHERAYTVFLERESVVDGKIFSVEESVAGLECNLVPDGGIEKISTRRPIGYTTYNVGGRSGRSMFEFRVPQDGAYNFACGYSNTQRNGPQVVVAVGAGVAEGIAHLIFTGIAGLFGGLTGAGIVIAAVFILRERYRREHAAVFGRTAT